MSDLLVARNVVKEYREAARTLTVLDGLDLAVQEGEMLAITGHSGVGKSTLLHILGLLDTPTSGSVTYRETELGQASEFVRARLRNTDFGFVFQFYHLLPDLDAAANVMLPAMVQANWLGWPTRGGKARQQAKKLLDDVGLADRASHRPSELSGGEKQRVALARALMNAPRIVFCDEPTGNLDEKTSGQIHDLLWKTNRRTKATMVIVTHNEELASRCHRVARMHNGRVSELVKNHK